MNNDSAREDGAASEPVKPLGGMTAVVLRRLLAAGVLVDLVVAGTQGRNRVAELFLGSVAQALLDSVPGDIMIVPRSQ